MTQHSVLSEHLVFFCVSQRGDRAHSPFNINKTPHEIENSIIQAENTLLRGPILNGESAIIGRVDRKKKSLTRAADCYCLQPTTGRRRKRACRDAGVARCYLAGMRGRGPRTRRVAAAASAFAIVRGR